MASGGGMFSPEEVKYLRSLPAVAEVSERRITYADAFKESCMRRYVAGESPVELFREAGLDPALIGYKRIERCFARWRRSGAGTQSRGIADRLHRAKAIADDGAGVEGGVDVAAGAGAAGAGGGRSRVIAFPPRRDGRHVDMRDLLIYQQVRRIDELERRVDALLARLRERHARPGETRHPGLHMDHMLDFGADGVDGTGRAGGGDDVTDGPVRDAVTEPRRAAGSGGVGRMAA